jgi:hypothetical protein
VALIIESIPLIRALPAAVEAMDDPLLPLNSSWGWPNMVKAIEFAVGSKETFWAKMYRPKVNVTVSSAVGWNGGLGPKVTVIVDPSGANVTLTKEGPPFI